ncbi:NUDIX hydrolase [Amphibacillus sp. Q70]|uniref:NUDIX hydrolase n=1 Tax=Amphibacillus sp. Q70 TaxID=3453416 RepID=UPI003F83996E
MEKWKVLNSQYIYKTPYGNLRRDKCQLENGVIIEEYNVHEYVDWINAVIVTEDHKIILIRQYRHGAKDFFYEIPAGSREPGETNIEAIEREVLEETGYQSETPLIDLGEFFVNPALQNNKVISYLMLNAKAVSEQNLDETEQIEVFKYSLNEIKEMIKTKEISQMFSIQAILLAEKYIESSED